MLEKLYKNKTDIPTGFEYLYHEKDGEWHLKTKGDIKTIDDVNSISEALRKEKEDHKEVKVKLSKFDGLDPDETREKLDSIPELEAKADASKDVDEKIKAGIDARMETVEKRHTREIDKLTTERNDLQGSIVTLQTERDTGAIQNALRAAGTDAKVRASAMDDVLMHVSKFEVIEDASGTRKVVTKDGGHDPTVWLTDIKDTKDHWFPNSTGGDSRGSESSNIGKNPFTHENWNSTEQGKIFNDNPERARQLAESAGTSIGGAKPEMQKSA